MNSETHAYQFAGIRASNQCNHFCTVLLFDGSKIRLVEKQIAYSALLLEQLLIFVIISK